MVDERQGRLANAGHMNFSSAVGGTLDGAVAKVRRAFRSVPMPLKVATAALAASFASLTAGAPPTYAQAAPTAQIAYGDLSLASTQGQAALDARIRGAARALCLPAISVGVAESQANQACYTAAVRDARLQVERVIAARADSRLAQSRTLVVAAR